MGTLHSGPRKSSWWIGFFETEGIMHTEWSFFFLSRLFTEMLIRIAGVVLRLHDNAFGLHHDHTLSTEFLAPAISIRLNFPARPVELRSCMQCHCINMPSNGHQHQVIPFAIATLRNVRGERQMLTFQG